MKKLLSVLLVLLVSNLVFSSGHGEEMKDESFAKVKKGKKAILLVHFGTSYPETRKKTIDAIEMKVIEEFPDYEVRRAFTSRIIMKILKDRDGIIVDNPSQALHKLAAEGYTHIVVQATHVINGVEAETMRKEIEINFPNAFESMKIGNSLLTSVHDYKKVAKGLYNEFKPSKKEALVLVGHGTHHHGNSAYGMIDSVFKYEGMKNVFICTVEGYPELGDVSSMLKKEGYKNVMLAPFMFVAGDHAENDVAVDFKEELEDKGFRVKVVLRGLGESKTVQDLFINHIEDAITNVAEDMIKKKKDYSEGK